MFSLLFLDLATIAVAIIALLSARLPFLSYTTLAHILSHVLAAIFLAELSQGQTALMYQTRPSVTDGCTPGPKVTLMRSR